MRTRRSCGGSRATTPSGRRFAPGGRCRPWLRAAGGVALTEPRTTGTTIQHLGPGRYYVAGVGNERGTVAQFHVTGGATSRSPPPAPARLDAYEYGFSASALRAGRTSVDFRNMGGEPHHVYFAPLRAGATLADVREFFAGSKYVGCVPAATRCCASYATAPAGRRTRSWG